MSASDSELQPVLDALTAALGSAWRRATFSAPVNDAWERITAEPVRVKQGPAVKLVMTSASGPPTTRTVGASGWASALGDILAAGPRNIHVATQSGDWHARKGKRRWLVSLGRPSQAPAVSADGEALPAHDRSRRHLLDPSEPAVRALFQETGLVGKSGQIRGEAAGKYRQVQHFLELLRPLAVLREGDRRPVRIVDAGCGGAHLGLALYLFAVRLGLQPELTGIDRNEVLVERVAGIAARLQYPRTRFLASPVGEVERGDLGEVDLLVSLHLCDTATDDALLAGVRSGARAIVLAPCCQHELIAQLQPARLAPPEAALTRHGALRERLASLLTDEFRALALEASGYRVDVLDFTGPENTGKSLMLRAERRGQGLSLERRRVARSEFDRLAAHWGVSPACASVLAEAD